MSRSQRALFIDWGGTLAALRFARHSELILAQLLRTMAYSAAGSALWALLPVIGQRQLGTGAAGFGALIGCLGVGAVGAGLFVSRARTRLGLELLVHGGCVIFAAAMAIAAWSRWHALVYVAGWPAARVDRDVDPTPRRRPARRRGCVRAPPRYALSALGTRVRFGVLGRGCRARSACGRADDRHADDARRDAAGAPFPLRMGLEQDVTAAPRKDLFVAHEPDPQAGRLQRNAYRIRADDAPAFDALTAMRAPRVTARRSGASTATWAIRQRLRALHRHQLGDYLHQRNRATLADQTSGVRAVPKANGDDAAIHRRALSNRLSGN
jgi:hypothetical protein